MTFALPAILAGLAAIVLPPLIHWLFRPRARRIRFPAATFMAEALATGRRAKRVRDFWLMLLRMLVVAAVVLLLAAPIRPGKAVDPARRGPSAVAIVVDDSASTAYRLSDARSIHDLIIEKSKAIADEAAQRPPGTVAGVFRSGGEPGGGALDGGGALGDDFSQIRRVLGRAIAPASANPLGAAIRRAARALAEARPARKELVVVTDLAAHAWRDVAPGVLRDLGDIRVRVVAPDDLPKTNLSIAVDSTRARVKSAGRPFALDLSVSAAGVGAPASVVVREDGAVLERLGPFEVDAGTPRICGAILPARPAGTFGVAITVEPSDRLGFDQTAWFAWETGPRPSVWFIRPAKLNADDETAELIWRNLLAPESLAEAEQPLGVEAFEGGRGLDHARQKRPDLIVLMSGIDLTEPARRAITDAVQGGAVLLLVCGGGDSIDWPGLRRLVADDPPRVERMPTTQTLAWKEGVPGELDDPGVEELTRTPVRRRLIVKAGAARIEAQFTDGAPAIIAQRVGRGRVVLLASSPDPLWSDFGLRAAGLLSWLNALAVENRLQAGRAANFLVGEEVKRSFDGLPDQGAVTVRSVGESGGGARVAIAAGQPVEGWPTARAGLFEILGAGPAPLARFAVNWPAEESDLAFISGERLASILGVESVEIETAGAARQPHGVFGGLLAGALSPDVLIVLLLLGLIAGEISLSTHGRRS